MIPRYFASTKTCSSCGWVFQEMTLSDRVFCCKSCGLVADRDTNAAADLAAWGEAWHRSAAQAPDPKHGAGSPMPVEGAALAVTSVTVRNCSRDPDSGKKQEPVAAPAA